MSKYKPIPELDGYVISKRGDIACIKPRNRHAKPPKEPRPLKTQTNGCGYSLITLNINGKKSRYYIHRLVAATYLGNIKDKEVNHINGIRHDNRVENLEYVNNRENTSHVTKNKNGFIGVHKYKNGKYKAAASINNNKLSFGYYDTAEEAHKAYVNGLKKYGINNKYAVNKND